MNDMVWQWSTKKISRMHLESSHLALDSLIRILEGALVFHIRHRDPRFQLLTIPGPGKSRDSMLFDRFVKWKQSARLDTTCINSSFRVSTMKSSKMIKNESARHCHEQTKTIIMHCYFDFGSWARENVRPSDVTISNKLDHLRSN